MANGGIPDQVLKQAKEAEKLYQESIDQLMATGPTGSTGEVVEGGTAEPTGATGEPIVEETPEQKAEKAQHKYEVLQGKYNKEVPELATRLAEQVTLTKSLQDQIEKLVHGKKPEDTTEKGVLDSLEQDPNIKYLKEEYPEVWKGVETAVKVAVADVSKKVDKLSSDLTEQKKHTEKTERDTFYDDVESIENYTEINHSPEFNAWLDEIEPLTGFKRRAILDDAYASLDATRAKNFFTEFTGKKEIKPKKKESDTTVKKDEGIAPRTTVTKPLVDKTTVKENFFKASEITVFYKDVLKGVYKGREAEREKREAELNKAISENRILVGQ